MAIGEGMIGSPWGNVNYYPSPNNVVEIWRATDRHGRYERMSNGDVYFYDDMTGIRRIEHHMSGMSYTDYEYRKQKDWNFNHRMMYGMEVMYDHFPTTTKDGVDKIACDPAEQSVEKEPDIIKSPSYMKVLKHRIAKNKKTI